MHARPKVFGVGLHKTGTSSLGAALHCLGYTVAGAESMDLDVAGLLSLGREASRARVWDELVRVLEVHDAAQDTPWWSYVEELDTTFPGSRFILTVRDQDSWLRSVQRHFGRRSNNWDRWLFARRNSVDDPDVFRATHERHDDEVRTRFADRPDDLLVLDMEEGFAWEPICAFLGHPVPNYPFPTSNLSSSRAASLPRRIVRRAWAEYQERYGPGRAQTRIRALWLRGSVVPARVRPLAARVDRAEIDALAGAVLPDILHMKKARKLPYNEAGSGITATDATSAWAVLEFELRHTIGQMEAYDIDKRIEGGTIGVVAGQVLDRIEAWAEARAGDEPAPGGEDA